MTTRTLPAVDQTLDIHAATIVEGRDWLRDRLRDGAHCPLCTQLAKVYRRKLTSAIGAALVLMHRHAGQRYVHVPTLLDGTGLRAGGDPAKARYWALTEQRADRREDGGASGFWRLTDYGVGFIMRRYRVPKYALIYDSQCLGLEGDPVGIEDVLGTRFDYGALMRGD